MLLKVSRYLQIKSFEGFLMYFEHYTSYPLVKMCRKNENVAEITK